MSSVIEAIELQRILSVGGLEAQDAVTPLIMASLVFVGVDERVVVMSL